MKKMFHKSRNHASYIAKHLRKHGHKYAGGMFAGFAVVKAFVLLAGFVGSFSLFQGHTSANFVDPTSACSGVTEIPQSECIALLNLYNSTDGDHRNNNMNRGDTGTICGSRYGITCTGGYVDQINLGNNNIGGSVEFSGLSNITYLDLGNNNIFSIDILGLPNLTYLSLEAIHAVSIDLSGLSNLTYLDLDGNYIYSIDLSEFTNLTHLELSRNNLSSIDLSGLTHLQTLNLAGNKFSYIDLSGPSDLLQVDLSHNFLITLPESTSELVNLGNSGEFEGFLDDNCWDMGSMSSDLISFLNDKAGTTSWQTNSNSNCPVPVDFSGVGLSVSTKLLDSVITDGSILRYRVDYHNNGATDSDHTQISIVVPSELQLLSSNISYTSEETGVDAVAYGTTGDVCYTQFMNETGLYMYAINQLATGMGAPDAYHLILNYPDPSIRDIFLGAPFSGQFSMLGEFFDALLKHMGGSFTSFLEDQMGIDVSTLAGCGEGQRTKYTRDFGTLPAGSGGEITIVTQAQNPPSDTTALDTILPSLYNGSVPSPSILQLPNDTTTKNHPIAISYTNDSDQGVVFRPNNPAYSGTYSSASILSGIIHPGMTDQQKVIALWQFVKDATFNYPGSDIKGSQWFSQYGRRINESENPVYFLNSFNGMCGEINGTLANLAKIAGFNSRLRGLNGHLVQEIYVDSGRAMLDADGGVYRTGEDGHIYSLEELADNPDIMRNNPQDNNYEISGYIDMFVTTGDNSISGPQPLTQQEANKTLFVFLHPKDTIKYGYSFITNDDNNGQKNDSDGSITHRLANNQYTNIYGEDYGVTGQTETGFIYADEIPYLVTTMDIALTRPTDKTITTSISTDGGANWRVIGLLDQRIGYTLNPATRTDNVHKYRLKFNCTDCTQDDITNIIPQITIKDNFIFNTKILPYTGQLDIYAETLDNASGGITVSYNTNTDNTLRFTTTITGNANESDTLNNTQVIDMSPWVNFAPILLPNSNLTQFAGQVFLWKGYTSGATSLFTDLPLGTLVGTSAISFLNTDTIPQNILIRGDNVEALLPTDTIVTETGATCDEKTLLAPQDITHQFNGVVKAFKIGSPCTGTSLDFSATIRIRVHINQTLGNTVTVTTSTNGGNTRANSSGTKIDNHTIEIVTNHFSLFKITSDAPPTTETGNTTGVNTTNNGGFRLFKDNCPDGDFSPSYYDYSCVSYPATSTGTIDGIATAMGDITNSPYSAELNAAYLRAYEYDITTMPTIQQADLQGPLLRKDIAKMITNFALNILKKDISTGSTCSFNDMQTLPKEAQYYAMAACRLGLMGYANDGVTMNKNFNPDQTVDRAQFGTILSRLLRGSENNEGTTYYTNHLAALKDAGIMTNIATPNQNELRGRVMLMMQRVFNKK